MKIGIMYDTPEMHSLGPENEKYHDFCSDASATLLKTAFEEIGYNVHIIGNEQNLITELKNKKFDCDIVYNTVEGLASRNREGVVPTLLEVFNIPYIGTDAYGLSTSLDKTRTKILAENLGIITPKYVTYDVSNEIIFGSTDINDLKLPLIVKPNFEGNSSGISILKSHAATSRYISKMIDVYASEIICEEFIKGLELTVGIVGTGQSADVLGITAIDKQVLTNDYDFWLNSDEKLFGNSRDVIADLSGHVQRTIETWALKIYRAIGCRDFGRVDFRLGLDGVPYFLEINPIPALSYDGTFGIIGDKVGIGYNGILSRIINSALERYPSIH